MADAIGKKNNSQTYLRQIQQEKAKYKRELAESQRNDMKAVREYYAEQNKELERQSADAVVEIKAEARQMAEADRQARADSSAESADLKRQERQQRQSSKMDSQASQSSVEKKNLYNNKASSPDNKRAPVIQNYETKETDDFYAVQNRGSRIGEGAGYYTIDAYAPEHEKNNLRVSIQRNKATISGQRKFEDEAAEGDKNMRTNNFQSFREEFKFDRPVSGEGMKRERIGDFVRFTIPKLEAVDEES